MLPAQKKNNGHAPTKSLLSAVLVILLTVLIGSIICLSCVPPVSRDALTHHLALPKLYIKHGGMYEIPAMIFSYYPMNLELLYIIPLYFGNDIAPKLIHFAFALLTAGLLYGYLKNRLDQEFALLGALFFLSLPIIVKLSITVYVDLGLIFFSAASLIYVLKWIEHKFEMRLLVMSAVFCGLALGTKYNGLITFLLLSLFVTYIYSKVVTGQEGSAIAGRPTDFSQAQRVGLQITYRAVRQGATYMLIVLIVFSPWMIRNLIWVSNPIYPLYHSWFKPHKSPSLTRGKDHTQVRSSATAKKPPKPLGHFAVRRVLYHESLSQILLIPIRIFFQGQDDNPKYFDGKLSPYLFFFPFFVLLNADKVSPQIRTESKILFAFSILYLLFAFFNIDMRIRYIVPIIPPLIILSIFGLHQLMALITERFGGMPRRLLIGGLALIVAFMLSSNAAYVLEQFRYVDPLSYIGGRLGRDEYIQKYRPEYAALKYANEYLPQDAKILALYLGNRRYYSDRNIYFGVKLFERTLKRSESAEKLLHNLGRQRITHLLVRYDLFDRFSKANFNAKQQETLRIFFERHTKKLLLKDGHGLYELEVAS
ncbi:MAG: phospholipid carrier-dependent glycosyltransferase [Desulfobacterales bacterium]|nr:MAG: phospholipid carrier-dependent glycosyltransferase [Desulfobacterales bacterium]